MDPDPYVLSTIMSHLPDEDAETLNIWPEVFRQEGQGVTMCQIS